MLFKSLDSSGILVDLKPNGFPPEFLAGYQIQNPNGSYVYGHYSKSGQIFYVGKGAGKRAWNDKRNFVWDHFVRNHLNGQYDVKIIKEGLTDEEAETLEGEIMSAVGERLVNWINLARKSDYAADALLNKRRADNKSNFLKGKDLEKTSVEDAISIYIDCLKELFSYGTVLTEQGFMGQLLKEIAEKDGYSYGDVEIINRLTICLCKVSRSEDAHQMASQYFSIFKKDINLGVGKLVIKRVLLRL